MHIASESIHPNKRKPATGHTVLHGDTHRHRNGTVWRDKSKIFLYKFWALQIKPCEDTNFKFTAPHSLLTHVQRSPSGNREWGSAEACVEKKPWNQQASEQEVVWQICWNPETILCLTAAAAEHAWWRLDLINTLVHRPGYTPVIVSPQWKYAGRFHYIVLHQWTATGIY